MSTKSVKAARNLERPRPLRRSREKYAPSPPQDVSLQDYPSHEDVLNELESFQASVRNGYYDVVMLLQIDRVYDSLKTRGPRLEAAFPERLETYFLAMRDASGDRRLPLRGRLKLLELIELRSMNWDCRGGYDDLLQGPQRTLGHLPATPALPSLQLNKDDRTSARCWGLSPGVNPHDQVVRSADSEAVSAKTRRSAVQVNGSSQEDAWRATDLTGAVCNNAFAVPNCVTQPTYCTTPAAGRPSTGRPSTTQKDPSAARYDTTGAATLREYSASLLLGGDLLKLSSPKEALIVAAKAVLEKHFNVDDRPSEADTVSNGHYCSSTGEELVPCQRPKKLRTPQRNRPSGRSARSSRDYEDEQRDDSLHKTIATLTKSSIVYNGPQSQQDVFRCTRAPSKPVGSPNTPDSPAMLDFPERGPETPSSARTPKPRTYTRDFLNECARSPQSTALPPDFPSLDPEIVGIMVRQRRRLS